MTGKDVKGNRIEPQFLMRRHSSRSSHGVSSGGSCGVSHGVVRWVGVWGLVKQQSLDIFPLHGLKRTHHL